MALTKQFQLTNTIAENINLPVKWHTQYLILYLSTKVKVNPINRRWFFTTVDNTTVTNESGIKDKGTRKTHFTNLFNTGLIQAEYADYQGKGSDHATTHRIIWFDGHLIEGIKDGEPIDDLYEDVPDEILLPNRSYVRNKSNLKPYNAAELKRERERGK